MPEHRRKGNVIFFPDPAPLQAVKELWPDFLNAVKRVDTVTYALLCGFQPVGVEGDSVVATTERHSTLEKFMPAHRLKIIQDVAHRILAMDIILTNKQN